MRRGDLEISELTKSFGEGNLAVNHISLTISAGEFFCLVGPSGCGKTTTLGLIAGYVTPDDGSIHLGRRDLTHEPPNKRDIGFVFQDYALFPHMSARENIVYGLRARKAPKDLIARRATELLELVGLAKAGHRLPGQLSGGQRQRVAVARALAIDPSLLLLDEPLSNLDAQLRKTMQDELRRLHDEVGRTTIMVTHDQEEAFAVADRIAVMRDGVIEQTGTPREVYVNPVNEFVARFMGPANILRGRVVSDGPAATYELLDLESKPLHGTQPSPYPTGSTVGLIVRPEAVTVNTDCAGGASLIRGVVASVRYRTSRLYIEVTQGETSLNIDADPKLAVTVGQQVGLGWQPEEIAVVRGQTKAESAEIDELLEAE
jgi:ABC-type Fe3+/spermidine/putrescine transport system ATPase subunit